MSHIVLATLGSYGDLFPYLTLGRALAARGHTPVIATSPSHEPIVASAGLAFHALHPDIDVSDRALMESLDVGEKVVTAGGMIGTIEQLDDRTISLRVAPDVVLTFIRPAVTRRYEELDRPEDAEVNPEDAEVNPEDAEVNPEEQE